MRVVRRKMGSVLDLLQQEEQVLKRRCIVRTEACVLLIFQALELASMMVHNCYSSTQGMEAARAQISD